MDLSKTSSKLKLGFTLGDIAGIGPEIFEKFTQRLEYTKYKDLLEIILIDDLLDFKLKRDKVQKGKASKVSGEHIIKTLKKANKMALSGEIDYLITGPVAKESLALAGDYSSGQTEFLAKENGLSTSDVEMFFICKDFRTVLATRHVAINKVSEEFQKKFTSTVTNSLKAMQNIFGITNPKIAIAGLNPHCGENGLIGSEEKDFLRLKIQELKQSLNLVTITEPLAADSLFAQAGQNFLNNQKQDYDLYVAAYHDQALPMIKAIAGFNAINLSAGLPYIRVSVDHGTAFDIVGQNKASEQSLIACTEFCLSLAKEKNSKKRSKTSGCSLIR